MRVLQVARYGTVKGGAETYVRALCEGLRDAGHEVALAYALEPDRSREEVRAGFEIRALAGDTDPDPAALAGAIEVFRPDVVHVHLPDVPWVGPAAAARAPAGLAVQDHRLHSPAGTKYWTAWKKICTIDPGLRCFGYQIAGHCGSLRANLTGRPYRNWRAAQEAAKGLPIQVFSNWIRERVVAAGIPADRVTVTHYPAPPLEVPVAPPEADRRPMVFASGRLNKEKGFHQLIAALGVMRTPVHLVIAGEGHERDALERRARATTGGHRITFTGWLSAAEVSGWLQQAALVAVPSMWPEPFGIAGLEAMASGKAVVAFRSGGIPEWLDDGRTGILVPHGDVRALAASVERLVRDPDEAGRMGEAGKARAQTEFSLVSHIERVIAWYGDVQRDRKRAA